jgi:D-glucosaminate PTS system EIIB component
MPVELHRIDDRLIHGQVVVGWGQPLGIGLIVLVDDAIATSDWEQELYRMAVPPEMELRFLSVDEAARAYQAIATDPRKSIVLTGDIATMRRLADALPMLRAVNLGGLHHRPGRVQRMRYIFLTPDEEAALQALAARDVAVSAQDVPSARSVGLPDVLAGREDA